MPGYSPTLTSQKPEIYNGPEITQFTEGDLHGNTMRLLESLVHYGVIQIEKITYAEIFQLYAQVVNNTINKADANKLSRLLKTIKVTDSPLLIRLIGDTLADRTGNDFYTLVLMDRLLARNAKLRILMSNHDIFFLRVVMSASSFEAMKTKYEEYKVGFFEYNKQGQSFSKLMKSIENGEVPFQEVQRMARNYFSTLLLLDYSVSNGKLTIYSHAPINLKMLRDVAKQFKVTLSENSSHEEIIACIDKINEQFRKYIKDQNIACFNELFDPGRTAADKMIWNREAETNYDEQDRESKHIIHEFMPSGLNIDNCYGHDRGYEDYIKRNNLTDLPQGVPRHVIRLDNTVGKGTLGGNQSTTTSFESSDPISAVPEPLPYVPEEQSWTLDVPEEQSRTPDWSYLIRCMAMATSTVMLLAGLSLIIIATGHASGAELAIAKSALHLGAAAAGAIGAGLTVASAALISSSSTLFSHKKDDSEPQQTPGQAHVRSKNIT